MVKNETEHTIVKMKGPIMWPKLFEPDYGRPGKNWMPKWTLDLLLDKETKKLAKEHNLRIRKKKSEKSKEEPYADLYEGYDGSYLRIERPVKSFKGEEREAPAVKAKDGKTDFSTLYPTGSKIMIGNGTIANVRFSYVYDEDKIEEFGGLKGFLLGVQILELVEYAGSKDPDVDFVDETEDDEEVISVKGDSDDDFEDELPEEWK